MVSVAERIATPSCVLTHNRFPVSSAVFGIHQIYPFVSQKLMLIPSLGLGLQKKKAGRGGRSLRSIAFIEPR